MLRSLTISSLLHLVVLVWLVRPSPRLSPSEDPPSAKVEVEFQTRGSSPAARGRRQRQRRWNFQSRGDFGLTARMAHPADPGNEDTSGWEPEQWGYGGRDGMAQIGHTLQFEKLTREIENALNYPAVLGQHQLQSTVNARLVFAADSGCDFRKTRLDGAQPYFRVYILALLKKICALETIRHIHFEPGQTVDLSFRFALVSGVLKDSEPAGRIHGNVLMFTRFYPKDDTILTYKLGPLRGVWFAPAITLDWGWVVEHWDEWVDHKDPLKDFRP